MKLKTIKIYLLMIAIALVLFACKQNSYSIQGYIEGEFIYVSSEVAGDLQQLAVERGQQVVANQLLFKLNPSPEQEQLQQAQFELANVEQTLLNLQTAQRTTIIEGIEAQLKQANAQLSLAKLTLDRRQYLVKSNAVSQELLDEAKTNYKNAMQKVKEIEANLAEAKLGSRKHVVAAQEEQVKAAQANVARLQWLLSQKTLTAPLNAQVFDTFYKEGEFVPAASPVLALLAPKDIQLIFYVPEPILSRIQIGQTVFFNCDGCEKTSAKIYYISPGAEYTPPVIYSDKVRKNLIYRVQAKIDPVEAVKFHAGQPVDVEINYE